jgi:hypothetical protein
VDELVSIDGIGNLEEALGSDFEQGSPPSPETDAPAQAEGVTTPPPQADAQPEQQPQVTPDPETLDVPGGYAKGAFKQYREEIATLKAQVVQFQQQQEQARQQAEMAAFTQQLEELALTDPDQAAAALQQYQQQTAQQLQAQYEQQRVQERAALSVEYARENIKDFDTVVGALMSSPLAQYVNWAAIDASPNPGKALYEYAKTVAPVDREALKAELLAELKPQLTAQQPQAPKTIGNLPAASPATDTTPQSHKAPQVAIDKMTPEQLYAWQQRALKETS